MGNKSFTFIFILFQISCLFLPSTNAKKIINVQIDALKKLYKTKYFNSNSHHPTTDTSLFEINGDDDMSDFMVEQKHSREDDKIMKLPGQPRVRFDQYGGYVTIDEKVGRAFYYYLAEAQKDKHSKPLILWLNGGPGCSSLGYGALTELGPFRVRSDGKTLFKNRFAWNHAANVLFLESPAGVGFSYSNSTFDVATNGDKKTAKDNYVFLLNWLERFPEYKDKDFFISGESYSGHYVPQLAQNIIKGNKKANKMLINLKGIIIGNAVINDETDQIGMYEYFNSHALINDEVFSMIKNSCNFSAGATLSTDCENAMGDVGRYYSGGMDAYNIYYPSCHNENVTKEPKKASAYLNNPQVQEALHANVTKLDYFWQPCSSGRIRWQDRASTVIPLLKELIGNNIRIWVFSGDLDGRVPVTSTKKSLAKMNLPVKVKYYPWYLHKEVGGYIEVYEGLVFATIRAAGHQVPSYQPARALSLIMHFLDGTPMAPTKNTNLF